MSLRYCGIASHHPYFELFSSKTTPKSMVDLSALGNELFQGPITLFNNLTDCVRKAQQGMYLKHFTMNSVDNTISDFSFDGVIHKMHM